MKKQNLKSLKLNKKSISIIESLNEVTGGAEQRALPKSLHLFCSSLLILCS